MIGFNVLAVRAYGDGASDSHFYPLPSDEDGQLIALEPADGSKVIQFWASSINVYDISSRVHKRLAGTPRTLSAVFVSDCRVAVACERYEKGSTWVGGGAGAAVALAATVVSAARAARRRQGNLLVGQLRYEWITRIGASPAGRGLLPSVVSLEYPDGRVPKALHLQVKDIEPVVIAQDIVQRAAAFRLRHKPELPVNQRTVLEELTHADRLQPTTKVWGYYDLPGGVAVGAGGDAIN